MLYLIPFLEPMMCVFSYEGSNLKQHLQKTGGHIYDNITGSPSALMQHCIEVGQAMVYINQLNVSIFKFRPNFTWLLLYMNVISATVQKLQL